MQIMSSVCSIPMRAMLIIHKDKTILSKLKLYQIADAKNHQEHFFSSLMERNNIIIGIIINTIFINLDCQIINDAIKYLSISKCSKYIIVTNGKFSESISKFAREKNIILWDGDIIKKHI